MELSFERSTGSVVALAGALVAAGGTFLAWRAVETPVGRVGPSAVPGYETTFGLLVLLVALVAVVALLVLDWDRARLPAAGAGVVVVVFVLLTVLDLGGAADAKLGLYVSAVGGVALAVGGGYGYL